MVIDTTGMSVVADAIKWSASGRILLLELLPLKAAPFCDLYFKGNR